MEKGFYASDGLGSIGVLDTRKCLIRFEWIIRYWYQQYFICHNSFLVVTI